MYPFFLFPCTEETTDEHIEARYLELLKRYPPDKEPERFADVRKAYERVRSERDRLTTHFFYNEESGTVLTETLPRWLEGASRKRLSPNELAAALRAETKG